MHANHPRIEIAPAVNKWRWRKPKTGVIVTEDFDFSELSRWRPA